MRKILFIVMALALLALFAAPCYAGSGDAKTAQKYSYGLPSPIVDISDGNTMEVDSNGSGQTAEVVKSIVTLRNTGAAVSAAARVYSIIVYGDGSSTAGDTVQVSDSTTATGTPVLDISIGTVKDTKIVKFPGGVNFSTGVYVTMPDTSHNCHATIVYK